MALPAIVMLILVIVLAALGLPLDDVLRGVL